LSEPASRSHALQPACSPGHARILVIEDDPYALEALTLLLGYYGYDVVAASNGTDGLLLLSEATPDVVVTDWRMPGLSGLALCTALRQRHDTIPIIVVTSAEEVFAEEQPVNARLRKPLDPPLLNQVIRDELSGLVR
jgi:two-component system response regulator GlrR